MANTALFAKLLHRFAQSESYRETPVPGVHCIKFSTTDKRTKRPWRACVAIVAQGCKEVTLGREVFKAREGHYTVAPLPLPVMSRVATATPDKPFLSLLIDLDPLTLNEVAAQLDEDELSAAGPTRAFFTGVASEKMLEACTRLAKLFSSPRDARALGPLIVREIFFHLMNGPEGAAIRQFVRSGSKTHRISRAVHAVKTQLNRELDIPALAKTAGMSRSAFFKHFGEATSMSPVQYQKRLRLLEARRLMLNDGETAERAAFKVGYKSASQFSREYARMFGDSPLRDVRKSSSAREPSDDRGF